MMDPNDFCDTDSDSELPHGWEERSTEDGWVYYANHMLKKTQWENPKSGKRKRVATELPYGWERKIDEQDRVFYVDDVESGQLRGLNGGGIPDLMFREPPSEEDHINHRTTYTDPRLAFSYDVEEKERYSIRQRFDSSSTTDQVLEGRDLSGKVAVITGGNSGIGLETARALAHHGCQVVLACRNMERGNAAAKKIRLNREDAKVRVMQLDLASLESVYKFSQEFKASGLLLHYLILNAGVFALPWKLTENHVEQTFAINHVGHFYLTKLLTQCLIESAPSRVIMLSSESHRFVNKDDCINLDDLSPKRHQFWSFLQYNRSKLCNVLFSNELHRRLRSKGVTCNCLHPGNMMYTSLPNSWWFYKIAFFLARPFTKSLRQGAATTVFVATARELEGIGGMYFNNCYRCDPSETAQNKKLASKLWTLTEELISNQTKG